MDYLFTGYICTQGGGPRQWRQFSTLLGSVKWASYLLNGHADGPLTGKWLTLRSNEHHRATFCPQPAYLSLPVATCNQSHKRSRRHHRNFPVIVRADTTIMVTRSMIMLQIPRKARTASQAISAALPFQVRPSSISRSRASFAAGS